MGVYRHTISIEHAAVRGTGSNTWHFRSAESELTVLGPLLDGALTALNGFYGFFGTVMPTGTKLTSSGEWTRVDEPEPTTVARPGWTINNTSGDAAVMPPSQCIVVGWRTSTPTRGGRGRTFVGPLGKSVLQDDGTPSTSALNYVKAAADGLVEWSDSALNGAFGVWSQGLSSVPPAPVFRDVVSASVKDKFAVLRSRRD